MTGASLRCVMSQTLGMFFIFYITRTTTTYVFFLPFFLILPMILLNRLRVRREERKKGPTCEFFFTLVSFIYINNMFFYSTYGAPPRLAPNRKHPTTKRRWQGEWSRGLETLMYSRLGLGILFFIFSSYFYLVNHTQIMINVDTFCEL